MLFDLLENLSKPSIAAINGYAMGGGLEVAMAADIRLGKEGKGKLGLPEVHLGVLPGTGGTQRLVRLVGKAKAIEMMVTGQNLSMEEGKELGLVNEVLPAEDFAESAMNYARKFCPPHKASHAVGLIKRSVISGMEMGFAEGLSLERELQQQLFMSPKGQGFLFQSGFVGLLIRGSTLRTVQWSTGRLETMVMRLWCTIGCLCLQCRAPRMCA